jgi:tRNA threonylcarbamoyladenosine biosynthesis protein TsaE
LSAARGAGGSLYLPDVAATQDLGRRLAAALPADTSGWMILLEGDLGSGKSTLARALLNGLGFDGTVPSPTYTLVEPYDIHGRVVYHVDLYRISGESELPFLGWDDLRHGLMLIEWPERVAGLRDQADLSVGLDFDGNARQADIQLLSERAAALPGLASTSPVEV